MTEPEFDRIEHDRVHFASDAVLDQRDLSRGIGLRIEHHKLDAQLVGGALAAGDARLEVGDLQAEGHKADRLLVLRHGRSRRERERRAQQRPAWIVPRMPYPFLVSY